MGDGTHKKQGLTAIRAKRKSQEGWDTGFAQMVRKASLIRTSRSSIDKLIERVRNTHRCNMYDNNGSRGEKD